MYKNIINGIFSSGKSSWDYSTAELIFMSFYLILCFFIVYPEKAILISLIWFLTITSLILWANKISKFMSYRKRKRQLKLTWKQRKKYPIIIQYTPPKNMNSAEAWLLFNWKAELQDIVSLIYQRAAKWIIKIESNNTTDKKSKSFTLYKLTPFPTDRPKYEMIYFNSIFWNSTTKVIDPSSQLLFEWSLDTLECYCMHKWWVRDTTKARSERYISLSIIIIILFFYRLLSQNHRVFNIWTSIWLFLLLLFCIITIWWILFKSKSFKLTDKWAENLSHIIWYKNFINACDMDQIQFFLKQDPLFIDKTLPYAIAFWLDTKFLKAITPQKLALDIKNWYYSKEFQKTYKQCKWIMEILNNF